ncbi:MAG: hypothetical protein CL940_07305 [Deltaproteobacteria bacterium]|nr:hypothetical protein [Deltaproteobacteria bacterium]
MTEPDEPQIEQLSLFALVAMLVLMLLVVGLHRSYEHGVRDRVAEVQWKTPWDHLEERRLADERILTSGECAPGADLCRVPIDDAMDLLLASPERLAGWAPNGDEL